MLSTPTLTNINSKAQFFFAESPIHFNFQNLATDATIQKVTVELYIWRGFQTADLPATPTAVYYNVAKTSPSDNYITLEFSSEIRAYISSSNLNVNNPQWAYNSTAPATTSGEGVYFHIVYKVDAEADRQLGTYFATSGYRYSFEQKGGMYTTYIDAETIRKYAYGINYDRFAFNLTTVKETSFSGVGSMIAQTVITPSERLHQTGVKNIIAYVNRLGLWDVFTPFGKVTESLTTKREQFNSSYRNPLNVNSQVQHLEQAGSPSGVRKFTINSGLIDEKNNYQIRELQQSSKIYLVIFEGDVFTNVSIGTTVDSTLVSVDNTTITVDEDTVTESDLGFYKTFVQIPVKNNTETFLKKTRLNDKSSISYTFELEETNNFINNIF